MLGCYLDHVPPHLNQTVHCCVYSRCSWYITLCNIKAQIHILAMSTCCACSILIVAMFYSIPPCTPGKLLGISCPPSSHPILPPSTNHPGKPAREAKPNCILWKYTRKAVAHHHLIPTFGCKLHRLSRPCPHTQTASEPHRMRISTLSLAQNMQVMLSVGTTA